MEQHKLFCKVDKIVRGDLISMQINLLNACPSHCKSCRRYDWPKDIIPYGKLKELIIECKNHYDLETIIFSGGGTLSVTRNWLKQCSFVLTLVLSLV